jgi:hypothetical protein
LIGKPAMMGGKSLKEFAKSQNNKSLTNWLLSSDKKKPGKNKIFNINDKNAMKELSRLEQEPPMINTKPDKLILVNNKILEKHKDDAFMFKKGIGNN